MFGHSAFSERPFGDADVGTYNLTAKVMSFAVDESQTLSIALARSPERLGIAFIGAATGVDTCTVPTHNIGDLILIFAFRDGVNTAPSLPAGYTSYQTVTGNSAGSRIAYRIATATDDAAGTWTNATSLICHVYTGVDTVLPILGHSTNVNLSNQITYSALSLLNTDDTSWLVGFSGMSTIDTTAETPPTGMVLRANVVDAVDEASGFDTNGTVASSWIQRTVNVGGTSGNSHVFVLELSELNKKLRWTVAETYDKTLLLGRTRNLIGGAAAPFYTAATFPVTGFRESDYSSSLGLYVAVVDGSANCYTSTDGISWTARSIGASLVKPSVTWNATLALYCMVGSVGGVGACYTSTNGTTWTVRTIGATPWVKVRSSNGWFVAIAESTTAATDSSNGTSWTARTLSATTGTNPQMAANPANNQLWIVSTGNSTAQYYIVNNGGTSNSGGAVTTNPKDLIHVGNGLFLMTNNTTGEAATNYVRTATSVGTWTNRTLPSTQFWSRAVVDSFNNTVRVIASGSNVYADSANGTTGWTSKTLPSTQNWDGFQVDSTGHGFAIASDNAATTYIDFNSIEGPIGIDQVQTVGVTTLTITRIKEIALAISEALAHSASLSRNRRVAASLNEVANYAVAAVRNRRVITSVTETETINTALRRVRIHSLSITEAVAHTIALSVELGVTLLSFSISEVSSVVAALAREKKVAYTVAETETIAIAALARARRIVASVNEVEVLATTVRRTRNVVMTVTEAESIVANLVRQRRVAASVLETIVYTIANIEPPFRIMAFSIAEVQAMVTNLARQRGVTFTNTEVEALAITAMERVRRVALPVIEVETITPSTRRTRNNIFNITETQSVSVSLGRLKQVTLALAESVGYTFNVAKVKLLTTSIDELEEFSFGALRRTRNVASALNEVVTYAGALQRTRTVAATLAEQEAISVALVRLQQLQGALNESYTLTASLARQREVAATIAEVETVNIALGKLKLVAYAIEQTVTHSNYLFNRVRNATVGIDEFETIQASFNRARAFVIPVAESMEFSLDFNRLREQAYNITMNLGYTVGFARIREILQSIANATDYTFDLSIFRGDPRLFNIAVTWNEWENFGQVQKFVAKSETLLVIAKGFVDATVVSEGATTVVVTDDEFAAMVIEAEKGSVQIIPDNTI